MRKTNLIQLTVVALLLMGLVSQGVNATVNVTYEEESTPAVITATEPVKEFKGFLPSLDGDFEGNYANFSDGDSVIDRYNTGALTTKDSIHTFTFPEIVGPAHGIFIVELAWNGSLAGDLDLRPGYENSTEDIALGTPANVSIIAGDYYSGANPEYYYAEVNINSTQAVILVAQVWGYDNAAIDFHVNATWINYDYYVANTGFFDLPVPIIYTPFEGGVYAVGDLLHDPQRFVPLNYSYTPGTEKAWSAEAYDFVIDDWLATASGGSWVIEVYINGVDQGQMGGSGLLRMSLDVGDYNILYQATYGGEVLGSTNVNFTVAGIELDAVYVVDYDNSSMEINAEFTSPTVTEDFQNGTAIDSVSLWYLVQNVDEVYTEVAMTEVGGNWTSTIAYDVTGITNTTTVFYYFTAEDEYGVVFDFHSSEPLAQILFEGLAIPPTTTTTTDTHTETVNGTTITVEGESSVFILSLAFMSIGIMTIVRRRK
jgi:hypothetical protein